MTWIGATSGLDATLFGRSGRAAYDLTAAVEPRTWTYADTQPGTAGPVLVR